MGLNAKAWLHFLIIKPSSFTKNSSLGSVFAILPMNRRDMLKTITTAGLSAAVLRGPLFSAIAATSRFQSSFDI